MVKINRLQIQQHRQQYKQHHNTRTPIKKAKKEEIALIEPTAAAARTTTIAITINIDIKLISKTSR